MDNIGVIRVHHIGYYVKDINKATIMLETLGWKFNEAYRDDTRGIILAFGRMGDECIELVQADRDGSEVDGMKKGQAKPYHVCYEVNDIQVTCDKLKKEHRCVQINKIDYSTIDNKRIVHMYSRDIGVFELIER